MRTEKSLKRPITSFIILTNIIFLPLFFIGSSDYNVKTSNSDI